MFNDMKNVFRLAGNEFVLIFFVLLLLVLSVFFPSEWVNYPEFVDWKTIAALTGLLIITTAVKESGYFELLSFRMLKKFDNETSISVFLILLSVVLSTFLTNDIALFILIPLTVTVQKQVANNISKLVIFETVAVNVGSTFSPIGNPQNIFLWHKWNISFFKYIWEMLPLGFVLLTILLIFVLFVFPNKKLKTSGNDGENKNYAKPLFIVSIVILIFFISAIEVRSAEYALPFVFFFYLSVYPKILRKVDWLLIILFIVIFIEFHLLANIDFISKSIKSINLENSGNVFLFSGLLSQILSNVPAAVVVSKFSDNWQAISYGVNVGGNGLIIGSLANIIALRMLKNKKYLLDFHKYSIPYFILTVIAVYLIKFLN